jgi:beta-galactosidase
VDYEEKEGFLDEYPWHQANCGDLDICGFKRPQSYYRDILWDAGTQLYIAVHTPAPPGKAARLTQWGWPDVWQDWNWAGREGESMKVEVYSACEEVELFLNGRSLGRKPAGRAEKHSALFEVPYQAGELKALGYNGDAVRAEEVLHTSSLAASLRLTADRPAIQTGGDLCFVTVEILDGDGRVHPCADRPVTFTVSGAGELAAVGSGNPISEESYRGSPPFESATLERVQVGMRSTHRGRCLAVVKSGAAGGEIRLRAEAEGLDAAEIAIQAG